MDYKKFIQMVEEKKKSALEGKEASLKWEQKLEAAAQAKVDEEAKAKKLKHKKHKKHTHSDSGSRRKPKKHLSSSSDEFESDSDEDMRRKKRAHKRHRHHHHHHNRSESSESDSSSCEEDGEIKRRIYANHHTHHKRSRDDGSHEEAGKKLKHSRHHLHKHDYHYFDADAEDTNTEISEQADIRTNHLLRRKTLRMFLTRNSDGSQMPRNEDNSSIGDEIDHDSSETRNKELTVSWRKLKNLLLVSSPPFEDTKKKEDVGERLLSAAT